jgi:putative endonuclease
VTSDLSTRIWEHKFKKVRGSFSDKYNLTKLVYYEGFESIKSAIKKEKYIKGKKRSWKDAMINLTNPEWKDLSDKILEYQDLLAIVKSSTQSK